MRAPCAECGQMLDDTQFVFHPYLYCELYKLGHSNQEVWLADAGFVRTINVDTQRKRADAAEKERDEFRDDLVTLKSAAASLVETPRTK